MALITSGCLPSLRTRCGCGTSGTTSTAQSNAGTLVRESDAAFPCTSAAILPKTDAFACGPAGKSVFDWAELPTLSPRYRDYARLLASVGINSIVWDNVNGCGNDNQHILEPGYLLKLAPLAELFGEYGIISLITPCFTSPETVGRLETSGPPPALNSPP